MTLLAAFLTGFLTGGLTCLAVQGGLFIGLLVRKGENGEKLPGWRSAGSSSCGSPYEGASILSLRRRTVYSTVFSDEFRRLSLLTPVSGSSASSRFSPGQSRTHESSPPSTPPPLFLNGTRDYFVFTH